MLSGCRFSGVFYSLNLCNRSIDWVGRCGGGRRKWHLMRGSDLPKHSSDPVTLVHDLCMRQRSTCFTAEPIKAKIMMGIGMQLFVCIVDTFGSCKVKEVGPY